MSISTLSQVRDMTQEEKVLYYGDLTLPCGHGSSYIPGPEGGIMMNISCPTCGLRLSVVNPESGFRFNPNDAPGQVISEPAGYADMLKAAIDSRPSVFVRLLKRFGLV